MAQPGERQVRLGRHCGHRQDGQRERGPLGQGFVQQGGLAQARPPAQDQCTAAQPLRGVQRRLQGPQLRPPAQQVRAPPAPVPYRRRGL